MLNPKFKPLFEKAGGRVRNVCHGHGDYRNEHQLSDEAIDTFAELLVKKCGEILTSPEFIGRRDLDWDMVLKEHFGVK